MNVYTGRYAMRFIENGFANLKFAFTLDNNAR